MHGTTNARGVAILFKYGANYKVNKVSRDSAGRVLIVDVLIGGKEFTICNIYAPNEDDPRFFVWTLSILDEDSHPNTIIAGDLNLCFNIDKDKRRTMYNNVKAMEILRNYMDENYLVDVWRSRNDDKFAFTWKQSSHLLVMSRLDYFLISTGVTDWVDNVYIKPGYKK